MTKLLIIGARKDSLGDAVLFQATSAGWNAVTAGINGETLHCDIRDSTEIRQTLRDQTPSHILVTAGINNPREKYDSHQSWLRTHFDVNVVGVMNVLHYWRDYVNGGLCRGQFVAISSNSSHIARRGSMAYCASKTALSMALRCAARDMAGKPFIVYGWEPGLLQGTPMSQETERRFGAAQTRMPGLPDGMTRHFVAGHIFNTMRMGGQGLNGCLFRLDGGEQ